MSEEETEEEKEKREFKEKLRSLGFGMVPGGYKSSKKEKK